MRKTQDEKLHNVVTEYYKGDQKKGRGGGEMRWLGHEVYEDTVLVE